MSGVPLAFTGFGGLEIRGDGFGSPDDPAVVLLHGGAGSRRVWRDAAAVLAAAGRYAITLDLRGHGESAWAADGRYDFHAFAEDLRAVLAQLQKRPVVVGASLGGFVALEAMEGRGASLASGLVLIDAAIEMDPAGSERIGEILRRHALGFANLDEAAAASRELTPHHTPLDLGSLERQLRRDESGRYFWPWDPRFPFTELPATFEEMQRAAAALQIPTLVMHSAASEVITERQVDRLRALMPAAEFVRVEGAGLLLVREQSDAFNATLLEFLERRVPRAPMSYESGSDDRTLRDALGCFGTGVVVATTLDRDGERQGLTANSFTAVSLDPPLILVCLAKTSRSCAAFAHSNTFAVNVLHIGQQPDSARFAKRAEDRFTAGVWEAWETGSPILSGSLASIECDKHGWHDGGDHAILVGKVRRACFVPHRDPLLYFRGAYRRLHFL